MNKLSGGQLAGGNSAIGRVDNDFYATDPKAVEMLLNQYKFNGNKMLEPCIGNGNIANAVKSFAGYESINVTGIDIVDRGYSNTIVSDFLTWENNRLKYDFIISNPPYSMAQEFIEHGLNLLNENGQMAMFLKIQFLEGAKRKEFFENNPPRYIYVFRNRMATWNNGQPVDPNTGKKWATTMCHAWFVWEKNWHGEPIVRWL